MAEITHRVGIKANITTVYNALATIDGLAHWWTEEVHGDSSKAGNITFIFLSEMLDIKGQMVMEVMESNPGKNVSWTCVQRPGEWMSTVNSFELSEQDDQTNVIFSHNNWKEVVEFLAHCSMKWAVFLLSLGEYAETGKGKPSPGD